MTVARRIDSRREIVAPLRPEAHKIVRIVDWLQRNQFLTSGLTLMVVGALMALLRSLPATLWGFVVRRLIIWVEVPDRDPAFR